jgi:Ser/Thr protein kinase RdoA (MazF antagonist)
VSAGAPPGRELDFLCLGYPRLRGARRWSALPGGHVHQAWRVDADDGAYVVKAYGGRSSLPRLRFTTACQARIADERGIAPAVLPARDGSLVASRGGMRFVVSRYVAGDSGEPAEAPGPALRLAAAEFLADLHEAMSALPRLPGRARLLAVPRAPREGIAALVQAHRAGAADPAAVRALLVKDRILARLPAAPVTADLPLQVIHGDFHLGNLVREGAAVRAALDFDQACLFPRAYEVMRAATMLTRHCRGAERVAAFCAVTQAYFRGRGATPGERLHTVDFFTWMQLTSTYCLDPTACADPATRAFGLERARTALWLYRWRSELRRGLAC